MIKRISDFLLSSKVNDTFYLKSKLDGVPYYFKWQIIEIRKRDSRNEIKSLFSPITIYTNTIYELYNSNYGTFTIVSNFHKGESEFENRFSDIRQSFQNLNRNMDTDFYDIYSEKEFELENQKRKYELLNEYIVFCKKSNTTPDLTGSSDIIGLNVF
jgi:hypothetical protein